LLLRGLRLRRLLVLAFLQTPGGEWGERSKKRELEESAKHQPA
jgi:hypothetical protein